VKWTYLYNQSIAKSDFYTQLNDQKNSLTNLSTNNDRLTLPVGPIGKRS